VGATPAFFSASVGFEEEHLSDAELTRLEQTIDSRLRESEPQVELIALERSASERLRLFIDRPGGVDLDLCERVTRLLSDLLVDYSLEVSSPGPERPLTKPEHFRRFLGSRVRVRTHEQIGGQRSFTGRLTEADEQHVSVAAGAGEVSIPLDAVRRSNLLPDEGERSPSGMELSNARANGGVRS
jgi:ribosome maturation factor RimP